MSRVSKELEDYGYVNEWGTEEAINDQYVEYYDIPPDPHDFADLNSQNFIGFYDDGTVDIDCYEKPMTTDILEAIISRAKYLKKKYKKNRRS